MSRNRELWNTEENADAYDSYARTFSMYKDTSRDLVSIAGIKPGLTVIDLAAGTGATTQAILDTTKGDVHIIAVDQAEEMLKKVKKKFSAHNVLCLVAAAEELDTVIHTPVDAVICNSAFWQMKANKTFKAVSNVLKQNGSFAFNLPDHFFSYPGFHTQPITPSPYTLENLEAIGNEAGLKLVTQEIKTYTKSLDEVFAFSEIPVMKKNFTTEEDRKAYLDKLQSKEAGGPKEGQWIYLVFRKK